MEKWRLIKTIETNGAMQMAIDEAILIARTKNIVPNTLRFFKWKPPCITIGFFQSLEKEVDVKEARKMGVDVVRRYTGGGAVFHDKELTYSFVVSEKLVGKDVIKSYKKICNAIVEGLKLIGINSQFRPINDIVVNEKKISGNAQTRKEGFVLQHGTILIDVDVKKMFSLLKVPDEKIKDKMIKNVEDRVTSIKKELGKEIDQKDLERSILKGFEKVFKVSFFESKLTDYEIKIAEKLCGEKYSTKEWCYWR
ncbi:MAG: biotin/lipoate A/B protein ligase family protein [Candidatus Aenigmatarchaeota archaeon]